MSNERVDVDIIIPAATVVPTGSMSKLDIITHGGVKSAHESIGAMEMKNPAREIAIYAMTIGLLGEVVEKQGLRKMRAPVLDCARAIEEAAAAFLPDLASVPGPSTITPVPNRTYMLAWSRFVARSLKGAGVDDVSIEDGVEGRTDLHARLVSIRDDAIEVILTEILQHAERFRK